MSFTVLSDDNIRDLLENLTREEAGSLQQTLGNALHEYSTAVQQAAAASLYQQPERTSTYSDRTGATTLFIPSNSPVGHAMKVVTIISPYPDSPLPPVKPSSSLTLYSPEGSAVGFLQAQTLTAFRTALSSSSLLMKRTIVRTLTIFGAGLQAYWHIRLALMLRGDTIRKVNIINRTFSENAKDILKRFYAVPSEVKEREGWGEGRVEFSMITPGYGEYQRLQKKQIRSADVIYCCTPSTEELFDASILTNHEGRKKGRLIVAVGSYTKNMRELPKDILLQATRPHKQGHFHYHKHATEGGVIVVDSLNGVLDDAGEIIDAGLEPKQLVELGELIMIKRFGKVNGVPSHSNSPSSAATGSVSESIEKLDLTSSPSTAMSTVFGTESAGDDSASSKRSSSHSPSRAKRGGSTGEIQLDSPSGFRFPSLRHHKRTVSEQSSWEEKQLQKHEDHLTNWFTSGNVIYKSVGFGLMDLVVGFEVVKLANAKGVGSQIENFSP
ncbi:putative family decarboxylase [Rosellinia necatrix]|uniref:Putative family decarboxylase n=1 Tax=Rosellinia necatrix TaxID=77044 RepID=A0A1W2TG62_ROSNE|nr:putative family decarboxylase [Rosellinia necatrix]